MKIVVRLLMQYLRLILFFLKLYMYIYIHIYIRAIAYTHTHTHTHTQMFACTRAGVCGCVHSPECTPVYLHIVFYWYKHWHVSSGVLTLYAHVHLYFVSLCTRPPSYTHARKEESAGLGSFNIGHNKGHLCVTPGLDSIDRYDSWEAILSEELSKLCETID